jgi:hypothetical protein
MKEKIIEILEKEFCYSTHVASVTADDLLSLTPQLKPALSKWLKKREITNVEVSGFSIKQLMEQRGYTFPSALISMDWLLTDPETAKKELIKEVRK